jgi:hypothetical protein
MTGGEGGGRRRKIIRKRSRRRRESERDALSARRELYVHRCRLITPCCHDGEGVGGGRRRRRRRRREGITSLEFVPRMIAVERSPIAEKTLIVAARVLRRHAWPDNIRQL